MEDNQSLLELQVDPETGNSLNELSRWAKFFAILVLVACGLFFLTGLFVWKQLSELVFAQRDEPLPGGSSTVFLIIFIVVFLVVGAIITVLMVFLIKGANGIRNGIRNNDQLSFNIGLANIKNYFAMLGVLSIVGLLFSLLGLINR